MIRESSVAVLPAAGPRSERVLWIVAVAPLVLVPISHGWIDTSIARAMHESDLDANWYLNGATEVGESVYWLVPAVLLFALAACARWRNIARWAFVVVVSVGVSGLLATALKYLIGKSRPKLFLGGEGLQGGRLEFAPLTIGYDFNSFPSGHATTMGAAAMALALAFPRWRWPLLAFGLLIASTRVALHAHYLSDVCAGVSLGMLCSLATLHVWRARHGASVPVAFTRA